MRLGRLEDDCGHVSGLLRRASSVLVRLRLAASASCDCTIVFSSFMGQ